MKKIVLHVEVMSYYTMYRIARWVGSVAKRAERWADLRWFVALNKKVAEETRETYAG